MRGLHNNKTCQVVDPLFFFALDHPVLEQDCPAIEQERPARRIILPLGINPDYMVRRYSTALGRMVFPSCRSQAAEVPAAGVCQLDLYPTEVCQPSRGTAAKKNLIICYLLGHVFHIFHNKTCKLILFKSNI